VSKASKRQQMPCARNQQQGGAGGNTTMQRQRQCRAGVMGGLLGVHTLNILSNNKERCLCTLQSWP